MGILEIVFNSRKFDLNDDVLMGFDNYFDKKSSSQVYDCFSLHTCPHFGLHRQLPLPVQWKDVQTENIFL